MSKTTHWTYRLRSGEYASAFKLGGTNHYCGTHDTAKAASNAARRKRDAMIAAEPAKPKADLEAARKLVKLREAKRLSLDRLAVVVDLSRVTLAQYERGEKTPPAEVLAQILAVLESPGEIVLPSPAEIAAAHEARQRLGVARARLRDLIVDPHVASTEYSPSLRARLTTRALRRDYRRAAQNVAGLRQIEVCRC